jgi:hypothetical protein
MWHVHNELIGSNLIPRFTQANRSGLTLTSEVSIATPKPSMSEGVAGRVGQRVGRHRVSGGIACNLDFEIFNINAKKY